MSRNSTSASGLPECHFAVYRLGNGWEALEGIRLPQQLQSQVFSLIVACQMGIKSQSDHFFRVMGTKICARTSDLRPQPLCSGHM